MLKRFIELTLVALVFILPTLMMFLPMEQLFANAGLGFFGDDARTLLQKALDGDAGNVFLVIVTALGIIGFMLTAKVLSNKDVWSSIERLEMERSDYAVATVSLNRQRDKYTHLIEKYPAFTELPELTLHLLSGRKVRTREGEDVYRIQLQFNKEGQPSSISYKCASNPNHTTVVVHLTGMHLSSNRQTKHDLVLA